jgi:diguanylate cyclase (GGDEF)-like protein/PAS domain S-box-containing protein
VSQSGQPINDPNSLENRLLSLGEKLSRLRSAFLSAPIALCLIDQDLRYVEVNDRMASLNRRSIEAHIGQPLRDIVPNIADIIEPVYRQVFATGCSVESRPIAEWTEDGERFLLVNYNPVKDEGGTTVLVSVAVFDITAEKKALDEAYVSAQQLHDVLESTSDNIILLSAGWRITYVNSRATRLFVPRVLKLGETLSRLFPAWEETVAGRKLIAINAANQAKSFTAYFTSLDRWLELDVFPTAKGLSVFFRDVSDRRRAEENERRAQEKIVYLASHDSLTGLANRAAFYGNLDGLLAGVKPDGEVVLFFMDLDGFKAVNDTMGHPAGDAVLVAVSERLCKCIAGSAFVSRFGGDEFVIAKNGFRSRSDISALAEIILTALSAGYDVEVQLITIGVSIGVALATPGVTSDELVRQADMALYATKASGRRSYRFFEPGMGNALLLRQLRKREVAQALSRKEFYLEYQPIFDLNTDRIAAFEALLRWRSPLFSAVPIEDVIAIAEEIGLIQSIGEWVLQEACREAAHWPDNIAIAVNVSVLQIRDRSFGDAVKRILDNSGVLAARLNLEITETVLFVGEKQANQTLDDLRQYGVSISLDDFGTGYASLQYLKTLKVEKIKIDQIFVRDAHLDASSVAIIRAIVTLGQDLGIATVAEGVELDSQYQLLKRAKCDFAQGYFLGRPMSGKDCDFLIRGERSGLTQVQS